MKFKLIESYSLKCEARKNTDPRMLLDRYINIIADGPCTYSYFHYYLTGCQFNFLKS
jgi:hypothetical protein